MFGNLMTQLYLKKLEHKGFKHGNNFDIEKGANIDSAFFHLISCGDNVTLAKNVYILGHDASMGKFLKRAKIGKVKIGNNVFIGAGSIILPGINIGNNVIVATNSSVTKDIPSGEIWGGVPAKFIMKTDDFLTKHRTEISEKTENDRFWYGD